MPHIARALLHTERRRRHRGRRGEVLFDALRCGGALAEGGHLRELGDLVFAVLPRRAKPVYTTSPTSQMLPQTLSKSSRRDASREMIHTTNFESNKIPRGASSRESRTACRPCLRKSAWAVETAPRRNGTAPAKKFARTRSLTLSLSLDEREFSLSTRERDTRHQRRLGSSQMVSTARSAIVGCSRPRTKPSAGHMPSRTVL